MRKIVWYYTIGILALFATLLIGVSLHKFSLGLYNGLDLAIFDQVFWQTTHGNFFGMTIHPHSYLGDHFDLFILLLSPFYVISSRPETLLVLQSLAIASAPIPLVLLVTKKRLSSLSVFFTLLLVTLWVLNPFIHNAFFFEFHVLLFAAPILGWTYYFFRQRNLKWFWVFFILLLSIREDISLTAFMFPVLFLLENSVSLMRKAWRGNSLAPAEPGTKPASPARVAQNFLSTFFAKTKWWLPQLIIAALWFVMSTKISSWINPGGGYKFYEFYSWMGDGAGKIIWFILTNPIEVLKHVFSDNALYVLGTFFTGTALLAFFSPLVLLLGAPTFLISALVNPGVTSIFFVSHYSIVLIFVFYIAGFEAIPRVTKLIQRICPITQIRALIALLVFLFTLLWVGNFIFMSPFTINSTEVASTLRFPQNNSETRVELLNELENYESVMAGAEFLANLTHKEQLMTLHYTFIGKQQFSEKDFQLPEIEAALFNSNEMMRLIASERFFAWTEGGIHNGSKRLRNYLEDNKLKLAKVFDDTMLFLPEGELEMFSLESIWNTDSAKISSAKLYNCGELVCLNVDTLHESGGEDVMIKFEILDDNESLWYSFYLPAYGLYMPHDFENPTKIKTTWQLAMPKLDSGEYETQISLSSILGLQTINQVRGVSFLPASDLEYIDSQELENITYIENAVFVTE